MPAMGEGSGIPARLHIVQAAEGSASDQGCSPSLPPVAAITADSGNGRAPNNYLPDVSFVIQTATEAATKVARDEVDRITESSKHRGPDPVSHHRFVTLVQNTCAAHGAHSTAQLQQLTGMPRGELEELVGRGAFDAPSPTSWEYYLHLLRRIGATVDEITTCRAAWKATGNWQRPAHDGVYTPQVTTSDDELSANTAEEFIELLRTLLARSAKSAAKIAERAQIPRSSAYAMVRKGRTNLPTNLVHVRKFALACGLSPDKVSVLAATWTKLNKVRLRGEVADQPGEPGETKNSELGETKNTENGEDGDEVLTAQEINELLLIENELNRANAERMRALTRAAAEQLRPERPNTRLSKASRARVLSRGLLVATIASVLVSLVLATQMVTGQVISLDMGVAVTTGLAAVVVVSDVARTVRRPIVKFLIGLLKRLE
jgi:hypothetical protein